MQYTISKAGHSRIVCEKNQTIVQTDIRAWPQSALPDMMELGEIEGRQIHQGYSRAQTDPLLLPAAPPVDLCLAACTAVELVDQ